ncbi:MAG: hypothetical protein QM749_08895 [Aquabacterium sp.]
MSRAPTVHDDRIRLLKATAALQRLSAQHQVNRLRRTPALYIAAWSVGLAKHGGQSWLMKFLPRPYRLLAAGWPVLQHMLSLSRKYHEKRQDADASKPQRHLPH